jgi:hypothetical protein
MALIWPVNENYGGVLRVEGVLECWSNGKFQTNKIDRIQLLPNTPLLQYSG